VEFHHTGVFKLLQERDGVSNQNSPEREQQRDKGEREPKKKEEKTNKSSHSKEERKE